MISRRELFKLTIGGITASILAPSNLAASTRPIYHPSTTALGAELARPRLLKPGFYDVIIKEIFTKESMARPGEELIGINMETIEDNILLTQYVSEKFVFPLAKLIEKAELPIHDNEFINLDELIGKKIKVEVETANMRSREYNVVRS